MTAVTAFIVKDMQDSGKSYFENQVYYFNPTTRDYPSGWNQIANLTTAREARQQRQFCVADVRPEDLSPEAVQFWGKQPG